MTYPANFLADLPLFAGISPQNIDSMLSCLNPRQKVYAKGEQILHAGETLSCMGIVLSGSVLIVREDFWGNRTVMGQAGPGHLFGETYACLPHIPLEVNVTASEDSEILFLDVRRLLTVCSNTCLFHTRLIQNLLSQIAAKNLMLSHKAEHMSRPTTREKLLSYLSEQALANGSRQFSIPFDRQQLADYLAVERSAMSRELGKLRKEGFLTFQKNNFTLREKYLQANPDISFPDTQKAPGTP